MRLPFAIAAVVAAVGLTGLMVAGVSRGPAPQGGEASAAQASPPVQAEPLLDTGRLGRLDAMPGRVAARRNPFRFGVHQGGEARAEARPAGNSWSDDLPADEPQRPARPSLQLLGIAEDVGADGTTVRTAVVSAMNHVHLVREGDQVALRFLVRRVDADGVEVEDLTDERLVRLPLR
jgi:hypothetical protein